jgi:hypothetical protein
MRRKSSRQNQMEWGRGSQERNNMGRDGTTSSQNIARKGPGRRESHADV